MDVSKKQTPLDSPYITDYFEDFPEEMALLFSISTIKDVSPGEILFMGDDKSTGKFYIIESGKIKVSIVREDGSEKILGIHERNTIFGETTAIDGRPHFATYTILEKTRLREVDTKNFYALADSHPRVAQLMMAAFARIVRMLVLQIEDLSFLGAHKRVARMIYNLLQEIGQTTPRGVMISKKMTHEDIASLTGLSRVSVSLALNVFEELGILRKKRQMIEVFDMDRLRDIFSQDLM